MKFIFCALLFCLISSPSHALQQECVILLHGLLRSSGSMDELEAAASQTGYLAVNVDYDSWAGTIEAISLTAIDEGLANCREQNARPINFITHSLGGIMLRYYMASKGIKEIGKSVMIAPPNHGSETIDYLNGIPGIVSIIGVAGLQLGTDSESLPLNLGPVNYPVGIIAGDRSINPIFSQMLPNPDDGKVSVYSTKLDGMSDFIVLHHSHVFIMKADDTIEQSLYFLRNGTFKHPVSAPLTN